MHCSIGMDPCEQRNTITKRSTMAPCSSEAAKSPLETVRGLYATALSTAESNAPKGRINIENHAGFIRVPVGIAGLFKIRGSEDVNGEFCAPLATVEPTLVASCSRGCKAFNERNGLRFRYHGRAWAARLSFPSRARMQLWLSQNGCTISTPLGHIETTTCRAARLYICTFVHLHGNRRFA